MILDYDYLQTWRGGRVADLIDDLKDRYPEFNDFMSDNVRACGCESRLLQIEAKGKILSLNTIKDSPDLFCYYTGLPNYAVFSALLRYLLPLAKNMQYVTTSGKLHNASRFNSKPGRPRSLVVEDGLFVTLVRLCLGLPSKNLARRFGIAENTLSVVFNTWVILLAKVRANMLHTVS